MSTKRSSLSLLLVAGVIGGSGLYKLDNLTIERTIDVTTVRTPPHVSPSEAHSSAVLSRGDRRRRPSPSLPSPLPLPEPPKSSSPSFLDTLPITPFRPPPSTLVPISLPSNAWVSRLSSPSPPSGLCGKKSVQETSLFPTKSSTEPR